MDTRVAVNDGAWHHLAVTWRSATGALRVYKDGKPAYLGAIAAGTSLVDGGTLVVGQDHDWMGGGAEAVRGYLGQIDEVALYPAVLTQARVQTHRFAGALARC